VPNRPPTRKTVKPRQNLRMVGPQRSSLRW
jgi:hypothetical protein